MIVCNFKKTVMDTREVSYAAGEVSKSCMHVSVFFSVVGQHVFGAMFL